MNLDMSRSAANRVNSSGAAGEKGLWALNWLRFILALYLILFHTFRLNYPLIENTWLAAALSLGNMATSVFFVLSGFLLTHAYVVSKNGQAINRRKFLLARFSTLYPLHFAMLLLAIAFVAVPFFTQGGLTVRGDTAGTATRFVGRWEIVLALIMSITLTNAWNPFYLIFNGPSWSLSALAFYYLLFPVVALKIYRMKSLWTALVLIGILFMLPGAFADILDRRDMLTEGLLHRNPLIRMPLFVAGILLSVMFARSTKRASTGQWTILGLLCVATMMIATVIHHDGLRTHMVENGLYFPASLAIVWLCACKKPTLHSWLRHWGDRLGAASLPMFLLHLPMFSLFRKIEQVLHLWPSKAVGIGVVFAAAGKIEQNMLFYPLYLLPLIALCVFVQERFVVPVQVSIRNRYSGPRKEGMTDAPRREQRYRA
jgi:peptidoglycan/LPS O-acetylase OafA/YrhL